MSQENKDQPLPFKIIERYGPMRINTRCIKDWKGPHGVYCVECEAVLPHPLAPCKCTGGKPVWRLTMTKEQKLEALHSALHELNRSIMMLQYATMTLRAIDDTVSIARLSCAEEILVDVENMIQQRIEAM